MRHLLLSSAAFAALLPLPALAQTATPASPPPVKPSRDSGQYLGPDIVITANPFAVESDSTPSITAKVDRKEILLNGGGNLADSLANVPGVSATGFAAGASRPIIRGMDANRVRILEDGVSSSDVSDIGPDHGVPIDPLSAQSIEVVRGAGTLRYGSQAIGGVVNAINNRVPTFLPDKSVSGELAGSYATVADTWQGSGMVDAKLGSNFVLHADGFYRDAGDYDTPLGKQLNSFSRGNGESIGGSFFFGPQSTSRIGLGVVQYNAKYGIPSDTTYIDMKQTKVLGRASFDLGGAIKTLNVDASYADYQHTENEPDGTVDTTFKNKEFDGRAELLFGSFGGFSNTSLGVEVQNRRFQAIGQDGSYLFPSKLQSEAAFLFTDLPLSESFKFQASGRIERADIQGTPASNVYAKRNFTPISGALGALWSVGGGVKLGLTFSSTGRAPALTELFARGGHDGPQTFETGDPDLKIERANSLEFSLRVKSGGFKFEGSAYSTWFTNYIYGNLTGRTCDDDGNCADDDSGELRELFYAQRGANFRGLEGQASYRLIETTGGGLDLNLQADYTRATFSNGGGNVPRIPPYRLGGGVKWTSTAVDAGLLFLHSGRQDKSGAFDTPTPGFNNLSAQIAVRPFKAYPGIELAVVGQNLTNDVQRDAAALNKDLVVMPGRNVRFVLRLATF